ncbi:MAG: TrpR-related protein YerC/YecD [Clostridia bacterium]|nr:TrpR-related protein YerC/YecD [Clostridia bacterium]
MNAEHNHLLIQQLIKTIASIQNEDDCRRFFNDLCTNKEIEQMAQRWQAAKLLNQGLTYNQVIEQTDISSATLSRVSRALQYGEGYKRMFKDENK